MKLHVKLGDAEVVSPSVWLQVKRAIHQIGLFYGLHIEFVRDVETSEEIQKAWWDAVGKVQTVLEQYKP